MVKQLRNFEADRFHSFLYPHSYYSQPVYSLSQWLRFNHTGVFATEQGQGRPLRSTKNETKTGCAWFFERVRERRRQLSGIAFSGRRTCKIQIINWFLMGKLKSWQSLQSYNGILAFANICDDSFHFMSFILLTLKERKLSFLLLLINFIHTSEEPRYFTNFA